MDLGILGGIALIVIWAIGALAFDGPGWIHLLLLSGITMLIVQIAAYRKTRHEHRFRQ